MNEDGREILNCRWLAKAVRDAVGVCGLRGSFVSYLSVLRFFSFRGGQRQAGWHHCKIVLDDF